MKPSQQLQRQYNRFFRYRDNKLYRQLSDFLGFYPLNFEVYERAFKHKSISQNKDNNERLEFLGDSILDAAVAHYLLTEFPNHSEGFLTKTRSRIVSRKSLNHLAEQLEIKRFVRASKNAKSGTTSLYGNALEALVGAIYLDCGFEKAKEYILKMLHNHLDLEQLLKTESDYKSRLLEWAQKEKVNLTFRVKELPQHDDGSYQFEAYIQDQESKLEATAIGTSKKRAEQKAAHIYWSKLFNN